MKPIRLAPFQQQLKQALDAQFAAKVTDINRTTTLNLSLDINQIFKEQYKDTPKCTIAFTSSAYVKMMMLTKMCSAEVAAHGTVRKVNDHNYIVEDLLVYPQKTTSSTVSATDDYGPWLAELPDATFNTLRFHWHSHVNFGVSPSGVDDCWYETLLKDVEDFYIVMITNKRNELFANVYDIPNNLIYEQADIDTIVLDDAGQSINAWAQDEITHQVTKTTPTYIKRDVDDPLKAFDHTGYMNRLYNDHYQDGDYYDSQGRLVHGHVESKEKKDKQKKTKTKSVEKTKPVEKAKTIYELDDDDEIERAAFLSYLKSGGQLI